MTTEERARSTARDIVDHDQDCAVTMNGPCNCPQRAAYVIILAALEAERLEACDMPVRSNAADIVNSVAFDSSRCDHALEDRSRIMVCRVELEAVLAGLLLRLETVGRPEEVFE